jgi:hypothetical protein
MVKLCKRLSRLALISNKYMANEEEEMIERCCKKKERKKLRVSSIVPNQKNTDTN